MTNYEHIMSMDVEQLALFITEYSFCNFGCAEGKRLENEPLMKQKCDERCAEHCERWLASQADMLADDWYIVDMET